MSFHRRLSAHLQRRYLDARGVIMREEARFYTANQPRERAHIWCKVYLSLGKLEDLVRQASLLFEVNELLNEGIRRFMAETRHWLRSRRQYVRGHLVSALFSRTTGFPQNMAITIERFVWGGPPAPENAQQ